MSPKYDAKDDMLYWFVCTLGFKVKRLLGAVFGFMLLSFINGMVVRIALMCSNVVIFPLLWLIKMFGG